MSDVMSIFHGGMEHVRRQRDLEKVLIVDADKGGDGPQPLDLESGVVDLVLPANLSAERESGSDGVGPAPGR